jgi:hypothetical protein
VNDAQYSRILRRLSRLERREGLLYAEFIQAATGAGDKLTVRVPGYDDGEHAHGEPEGVVWMPRVNDAGAAVFPAADDPAYVMEASDGRWVVLAWTPT